MGTVLSSYYQKANEKAGLSGQIKLAMITKIPSKEAAELPDSEENIKIFMEAFDKI